MLLQSSVFLSDATSIEIYPTPSDRRTKHCPAEEYVSNVTTVWTKEGLFSTRKPNNTATEHLKMYLDPLYLCERQSAFGGKCRLQLQERRINRAMSQHEIGSTSRPLHRKRIGP
jgi:hypothetical protein